MKRLYIMIIIALACSSSASYASDELTYKYFTVENGLSCNYILDIEADNFGYLWVATDEGLSILAGDKCRRIYKSEDLINLPGNELHCLLNDHGSNTMWIGTQRNGIVSFNYVTGERRQFNNQTFDGVRLSGNGVTSFALGPNGSIWVGTYAHGINHINSETNEISRYDVSNIEGLKSDMIWSIDYDLEDNILYAGHENGGFSEIDPSKKKAVTYTEADGIPHNTVRKVLNDGNSVWICTDEGLARFDKTTKKIRKYLSDEHLGRCRDILKTKRGMVIAYEDFGVVLLNDISGEYICLEENTALSSESNLNSLKLRDPFVLYIDKWKNVIVGTKSHGIAAISNDKSYFTVVNLQSDEDKPEKFGLISFNAVSIASLPDGDIWVATEKNGIFSPGYDKTSPKLFKDSRILAMAADKDGDLWICDRNGKLARYSPKSREIDYIGLGFKDFDWIGIDITGDSIWISSNSGITLFDRIRRKTLSHYDVENNLIRKVAKDSEGNIYVGTFGQGLAVLDKNMNPLKAYKVENGFPSNTINDILIDDQNIFIATGEGLVRLNSGRTDEYEILAQPSRSVRSVVKDNMGNLWFATCEGVGVVMSNDSVVFFDRELPLKNFNIASRAAASSGRIYIGSSEGIMSFVPESVLNETSLSVPMISGITLDGENNDYNDIISFSGKEKIRLDYDCNNFTVIINNLDFFRQGDSFEYRMCGLDNKWYPVGSENRVTFRELPYGKYTCEVRNAKGDGNTTLSAVEIEILPPLWLRWWAIMIYIALLLLVAVYAIFWYKRRLRQQSEEMLMREKEANRRELQDERMAFFTNITHELRTPLTLINGPLEDLVNSATLNKNDLWKIRLINKNAQRLLQLVNQILDFRKTETSSKRLCVCRDNIIRTIQETTLKFSELNRNRDVRIGVKTEVDMIDIFYDREVLVIILDNLISNAMKYTEAGEISVGVTITVENGRRWVKISVIDTGHGISKDALPHIFERYFQEKSEYQSSGTGIGLALVKSLVVLHHGFISVTSEVETGTSFEILLPCDEEYPEAMHIDKKQDDVLDENTEVSGLDADAEEYDDQIMVLVVEDNTDILDYIEKSLSGIYHIKTAVNGKIGFEMAKKYLPDVIVSDIMMPVMNGIEMCRNLKNDLSTSHIPVVLLTAKDSLKDKEEGYKVGADSYLTKPFNASLLEIRINNIISRRNIYAEHIRNKILSSSHQVLNHTTELKEREQLSKSLSELDRQFMEKLDNIILDPENAGKVNVELLTDKMYMSKATLYRKMKALTGMSANEYIRQLRVAKAKEYILEGKMSMGEISDILGFSSQSYFRESFKAVYGMTPSDYVKSLK